MKKVLMLMVLILGLGGAGAGYYLFYIKPQSDAEAAQAMNQETETVVEKPAQPTPAMEAKPDIMDFYVDAVILHIREQPDPNTYPDVDKQLYRGDKVHLLEKRAGWGRISDFYEYEEGGPQMAEWISLEGLTVEPPVITAEERIQTLKGYVERSDDFLLHQEKFLQATDSLLKEGRCTPNDFLNLAGWVRSVTFRHEPIYFIYCGGLNQGDKIYLNVKTDKIFYP